MLKNIPFYQAYITNADEGIIRISLVDDPAVESYFVAFEKEGEQQVQTFAIQNEEERMICGVVMRCNFPIYRRRGDFEYYQVYNAETIKIMAEKMMYDNAQNNINLFHTEGTDVDGVNLVQLFIKDTEKGINPVGFEDIENGSLFAQYKVENDEVWQAIKDGTFKGYSLEGYFTIIEEPEKNNKEKNTLSIMNKIKELVGKILSQFGAVATDKGSLVWEGDGNLKEGDIVTLEDGNQPENGDYKTEDGKVITIEDGKVAKIEDAESEVSSDEPKSEEFSKKDAFDKVKAEFEATYQDVQNNIYSALKDAGIYGYIVSNTNDYAIVSVWGADDVEHLYRYSITVAEDGFVTLGEMIEVEVEYKPKAEAPAEEPKADEFAEEDPEPEPEPEPEFDAKAEIEALKAEIEGLKQAIADIAEKPAVPPVAEEFEAITEPKDGGSKLDRLCKNIANMKK